MMVKAKAQNNLEASISPLSLRRFRIRNYKSCLDSGDCWLSPRITILAGKKASGKTAILEGLDRIYNDSVISFDDHSIQAPDDAPSATLNFEISDTLISQLE